MSIRSRSFRKTACCQPTAGADDERIFLSLIGPSADYKGVPAGAPVITPDSFVATSRLLFGPTMLMIEAEWPTLPSRAPSSDGSSPVVIYVYVDDVDATVARALAHGATLVVPIANQGSVAEVTVQAARAQERLSEPSLSNRRCTPVRPAIENSPFAFVVVDMPDRVSRTCTSARR
jgi:hypothetical protein